MTASLANTTIYGILSNQYVTGFGHCSYIFTIATVTSAKCPQIWLYDQKTHPQELSLVRDLSSIKFIY